MADKTETMYASEKEEKSPALKENHCLGVMVRPYKEFESAAFYSML